MGLLDWGGAFLGIIGMRSATGSEEIALAAFLDFWSGRLVIELRSAMGLEGLAGLVAVWLVGKCVMKFAVGIARWALGEHVSSARRSRFCTNASLFWRLPVKVTCAGLDSNTRESSCSWAAVQAK